MATAEGTLDVHGSMTRMSQSNLPRGKLTPTPQARTQCEVGIRLSSAASRGPDARVSSAT